MATLLVSARAAAVWVECPDCGKLVSVADLDRETGVCTACNAQVWAELAEECWAGAGVAS